MARDLVYLLEPHDVSANHSGLFILAIVMCAIGIGVNGFMAVRQWQLGVQRGRHERQMVLALNSVEVKMIQLLETRKVCSTENAPLHAKFQNPQRPFTRADSMRQSRRNAPPPPSTQPSNTNPFLASNPELNRSRYDGLTQEVGGGELRSSVANTDEFRREQSRKLVELYGPPDSKGFFTIPLHTDHI
jgi:hypothetical protein